jgi:hypothetical protein
MRLSRLRFTIGQLIVVITVLGCISGIESWAG